MPNLIALPSTLSDSALQTVILAVMTVGLSLLVSWGLTRVMQHKNFKTNLTVNLVLAGVFSLALFLRYGASLTTVQGILLGFVLLYASCSDLTDHTVDDFLWVMVLMLALYSSVTVGIGSMLLGGAMVFVPQLLSSWFSKRSLGGADIKLSTALSILLGWQKGLAMLILGLLLSVIVMSLLQKYGKTKKKQPFALVPFLSVAASVLFFIS